MVKDLTFWDLCDQAFGNLFDRIPFAIAKAIEYTESEEEFVNWALRQIGKRNVHLKGIAIETTDRIKQQDHKAAKWIANNALAELLSRS